MSSAQFEDIRIEVPWGFVAGRWYGNRKVRPILALHGWQDNLGTWERLIPLMPRHVGILAIDFPGHGRSSKYPLGMTYHVLDYIQIIIRIVQEYKWSKVSLMGHSMGAIVCFHYAALYPHMIDMMIQIDMLKTKYHPLSLQIDIIKNIADKFIIENERLEEMEIKEPPSFTYQQLEEILHRGSNKSVDLENCKYLLERSIEKSQLYPDKYYFSRDGRVKLYVKLCGEHNLAIELAKRIRNVPIIIIRSEKFSFMAPKDEEIIELLKENNSNLEYHTYNGTHHLHLNNAKAVASIINPFILRHRPLILDSWTLDDNTKSVNQPERKSKM